MRLGEILRWPVARLAFVATVVSAGAIFWIAPRPGMLDFPEHVAQVALLRDLLSGTSPWSDLVRINWFTPYLVGYGLALPLSFVMPVTAALKLMLTLAWYAFVSACVALRRSFHGDRRLDWLFLPGFFGFAFQFGLYTFLVAAPLGMLFVLAARRYGERPTRSGALGILAAGVALFFSHGLIFLFACAIGLTYVLLGSVPLGRSGLGRTVSGLAALAPYALLALLGLAYFVHVRRTDPLMSMPTHKPAIYWDWVEDKGWHRSFRFLSYVFAFTGVGRFFYLGGLFLLGAPWLLGLRLDRANRAALVPLLAVVAIWLFLPFSAMKTDFLYQRFAVFLLPAYALAFRRPDGTAPVTSPPRRPSVPVEAAVALFCCTFLGVVAFRQWRFIAEEAPFEALLPAAEPEQRALGLIFSTESTAVRNPYTFHVFSVWYEVEKRGFVDFNFAYFLPQIVRFRPDRIPAIPVGYRPETFEWHALQGRNYRYFFVRSVEPLPEDLFDNDECRVVLVKQAAEWYLFERKECRGTEP